MRENKPMKLLSVAIPCYNSAAYMRNCIESLLPGGDEVEILIVDDGSTKDNTAEIADEYERNYPGICRAIHQENGGHGEAVNAGLRNATGVYYKVVDSDDWVNEEAYMEVLDTLTEREEKVLRLRFGLDDGRARTLEEVGKEFNVTRERIRQIEAKALRKLRNPVRSKRIRDFL